MIKTRIELLIRNNYWFHFLLLKHFRKKQHLVCNKNTEIVIEGYPRSANTFAVICLEYACKIKNQNIPLIAHHLHSLSQIKFALRFNIPTIVLFRNPLDAISSLILKGEGNNINSLTYKYINFYSHIIKHLDDVLLVNFNLIVNNTSSELHKIGNYIKINLSDIMLNDNDLRIIINEIEKFDRIYGVSKEEEFARPSHVKQAMKNELYPKIISSKYYLRSLELYKILLDYSKNHNN